MAAIDADDVTATYVTNASFEDDDVATRINILLVKSMKLYRNFVENFGKFVSGF